MLTESIKKQLAPIFDKMQESAFENPILKVEDMTTAVGSGKFGATLPYTAGWNISLLLTVSPEDDDSGHFWHASIAFVSKHTGQPKSLRLWTRKEFGISKDVLDLMLQSVGKGAEAEKAEIKRTGLARHGYKDLSEEEAEAIYEVET